MNRIIEYNHILDLDMLSEKPVIIDAGANVGEYVDKIESLGVGAMIIAIECSKSNYPKVNTKSKDNIIVLNSALGGESGVATFTEFVGPKKPDGNVKYSKWGNINGNFKKKLKRESVEIREYSVDVITLGDIIVKYKLDSIDFLKMDIEGGEYDVIESMDDMISKKIHQISIETHNIEKNPHLIRKLIKLGYVVEEHKGLEIYAYRK